MTSGNQTTVKRLLCGVSVVSVVTMAGCATIASKFRRSPVTTNRVVLAQSDGADELYEADAALVEAPPAQQRSPSARASDVFAEVAHTENVADVPEVNVYGEFDGFERMSAKPVISAVGFQQHTFVDEGYDSDVAIDATGKWMVFASTRHSPTADIYLQRTDGTSVTQLTNDAADDSGPVFSPDGKTIAFASTRAGSWDLYTMDVDGRNVVQVTDGPMQDLHPTFSPDGARLAYCSAGGRSGQWELWIADLRTHQKRMVGYGLFPNWSPNKEVDRIAFQRARHRGSRWFTLWTLDLVEGESTRVTELAASTNAAIVAPAWSPDGKRLAFATIVEPARMNGGRPVGQQDVWTMNADGTDRQRLTDGNGINLQPFWGKDNRVYFVSDRGGMEAVWSVRAPTGGALMAEKSDANGDAAASTDLGDVTN
ncbi:MAG TPA: DPP IV N-terminal domain-containing protein [Tepidisphaeraceae bacterium]|nr:DPP IV N-terminal domain-containing protein [Tepidisphaeraceae bacterium]